MRTATGSLARFGLIALLAAVTVAVVLGALLLSPASPAGAQSGSGTVDYDTDGDNLIEVSNLAQLNAIRYDLDGNGTVAAGDQANYDIAFPNALASMGCAATCTGYELTADLDFDTDGSGAVDSSDTYASWSPIGTSASPFVATFDGGGHTILKMTIRASASNVGLFGSTSTAAIIRNLALLAVDIDRASGRPRTDAIGAIVGFNRGRIERSYATGSVQGVERVGGLAGDNQGTIANSYANVTAGGSRYVGGLAGRNHDSAASITNSYSIGSQSAKSMMYSTGRGGFDSGIVGSEGGIVGANTGSATISASYWNSQTSSSPWSYAGIFPDNLKKTTAQLQSPTGATGIYVAWSAAIWDFGTSSQYPALKADSDGDGTPTAYEFGRQGRSAPEDYDSDDNGLIEVDSLVKLNAIRWDLDGNGASTNAGYALAFPTPAVGMGCPVTATDADDNDCLGYELTADLDFNTDTTGSSAAVIDSSDDYWDGGLGWSPIASESTAYMAVFDGGRHTIANLFINRPTSNMVNFRDANKSNYVGLFASLMSPGEIRHLRLTGVSVTGRGNVGAVVGHITQGTVSHVSAAGEVSAVGSSGGDGQKAGGLVGSAGSASVVIEYSYSTATVTAGDDYAGGLVGESKGEIRASYATGAATATGSYAGGLVGKNDGSGIIKASYATGAASGADHVGGLAGQAVGNILSSYSRGAPSSSSSPAGTNVGGLVGSRSGAGTITNSYWDVTTSGLADDGVAATGEGKTTIELQSPTQTNGYAGIYANWNLDLDSTAGGDDPWDFGTASQYPALKADFNDDGVKSAVDGDFGRQPRSAPVVNNSPTFSDAALSASIDENVQAGRNVGNLMTANDRDGDTLVYSLTGADGVYFAIDPSTAQIKSKFVLDYESKSSYVFQVKAVDPSGGEATMEVTVYVSDESEGATDSVDYDIDSDGLIEVDSLDQLDAMRHDLDGDGVSTNAAYFSNAFTTPAAGMGCPVADHDSDANTPDQPTCTGYELTADLDFNTDKTGSSAAVVDSSDAYWNGGAGWVPIGSDSSASTQYSATFDGDGHTISNLFISRNSTNHVGLFGTTSATSAVRNVGLESASVTGQNYTGALIGSVYGTLLDASYSTGSVAGNDNVGGLVGHSSGASGATGIIQRSYSTAGVTGSGQLIGGLAGSFGGAIKASYATGAVTGADYVGGLVGSFSGGITASYFTGSATGTGGNVGGLMGLNSFGVGTITDSYWNVTTSGIADDNNAATGVGKTTSQLQSPTQTNGYAGIYANWNLNLDSTAGGDDPWDFGTASQYPALKVEWDGDGAATAYEFGRQGRAAPAVAVDYDSDDNGLIEVSDLAQLNAMRWDLNGDGASTDAGYATAFPNPETGMGCPITAADADDNDCLGYELTANLDFDTNGSGTANLGDTYWNGGSGWEPIGTSASRFNTVFDGRGYTISNLFISRGATDYVGLFGAAGAWIRARNVGLEDAAVTGQDNVGILLGETNGEVEFTYTTGSVVGRVRVGGLVGNSGRTGSIETSYSTASVTGTGNYSGGLIGQSNGAVKASYATGAVGGVRAGGLVGRNYYYGAITASYARGAVTGSSVARGLVASNPILFGLPGQPDDTGTVTDSYWDVTTSGIADDNDAATGVGRTTNDLATPEQSDGYAGIYANWNLNLDSTAGGDDPWDFGTASQYPALKADFNRDSVKSAADGDFGRQPRSAPVVAVDYDLDDNNLIEVSTLAQLNAIRHDLDGNGDSTHADYTGAFLNAAADMGCAATCLGYELTADLDFDTNGSGTANLGDTYWNGGDGWAPIGSDSSVSTRYDAVFDGDGHTISNLFISRSSTGDMGLFGSSSATSAIRNVGLESANVTGQNYTGALIGSAFGAVDFAYSTGSVNGSDYVGGLVGYFEGEIQRSYSTAGVNGSDYVGGLVGNATNTVVIKAGYATGAVSGRIGVGGLVGSSDGDITASYSTGAVTGTGSNVGGLVGNSSGGTITNSYWNTDTSSQTTSSGGVGKTTNDLATPEQSDGYAGIYANWNLDLDSTAGGDDPWDFGTASQYPALKADFNDDGVKSAVDGDFGRQPRSAPVAANNPPVFTEGATASRSVLENTVPNRNIGLPVAATDADSDALTYALSPGQDGAHFAIVSSSGQLRTKEALNYENNDEYSVTVTVSDGNGGSDSIAVTITVDNESEPPGAPTGLAANPMSNGLRVTWTAPGMAGKPALTRYDVEYKLSAATAWTPHSHTGTGTTARITGLTVGATYNVRVRAVNPDGSSGWASANGIPRAPGLGVDYDTDDDGLIEIDNLAQLNAMRWDADGDGAGGGSGHDAAFPDAAPGMGCPSDCTGYELEADLNFDTNGRVGADSGDDYWNGGMGWAPFWYYGTFEGNRHTISNLYVNRPNQDYVGLFSTAGAYAEVSEVRNLGLENVDVTGREYAGGLAGRAHAPVRRVYTTGEVNGEHYVGGLVGEARNLISETYSKADVSGDGLESSNVGGLVGYLRLGTVKASYATGDVSAVTWVGGLVGHNSSSDDGGIIASYATGNLGFGGLEDADPPPGRWVDGFSSRYYLPYTPTWVGGLVGDSSGPVVASYSTGGHPISLAGFQPGERKDRSRRDLAYMMEVHWKVGGLIGKSYGRDEHDSYWDIVTSRHRPGDKDWVYGKGKTTEELQWVTGYTGIYADWNVDLDGDGFGDDPWDFGSSAHYPTLKVDWDGDGTATSYEFGGQGRSLNDHVPPVAVGGTGMFEVTVPENTPSGAPIFGVTLPLAPADASSYNLFVDAQWPDGASFNIDATTGQLSAMDALDYESRDTYRIGITAVATDGARHSNGIIIRVTDVAEPPGPPTGVTIVSRKGSLEVSWTAPDMAGKPPLRIYEVTYYHDGDKAKITAAGTTTYTMTHLTPLITYAVQVRARNVDGWGPDSAVVLGTPYWFAPSAAATGAEPGTQRFRRSAPPPGQPANLRATPQADGSALVTWDAPAEAGDDAFYRVRRRVDAADSSYQVIARRVEAADSGGVVAYRDDGNGREAGQRYLYSVRASDGDGKPLGRWTQGVRDNRPPAFAGDSATAFQVAENTAAGADIGNAITATDPDDGDTLTYLLGGADADHFAIDADSGQLRTSGALDYESKDSYAVTVIAADGAGLWAGLDATITVTDVQEAPAFAAASITRQVAENTAAGANIGSPVTATDSDGDSLTYTLGGTDAGHFAIDADSGQLQTKGALDYESQDSYAVTIIATDGGGLTASIAVTITVDDIEEASQPGNVQAELQSDGSVLVTWNAPAGAGADTFYRVRRRVDTADSGYQLIARRVEDTDNDGAAEYRDEGGDLEAGQSYIYSVRAFAGSGAKLGPWTEGVSVAIPAAAPAEKEKRAANAAPSFSDSTAEVGVAENTAAGTNIGDAVAATDPDGGDTLTYTLGSTADDGHFAVDSKTGQLQTSGALDYESQSSYLVTVTASDSGGLTASIAVTITVDDVADTPPGQPDAPEISNIQQTSFRITWTAAAAGSSAITGYGIQYKLSSEADSAYADAKPTKRGTVTGYNLVDRNGQSITAGTSYDVRVRARNAEGWGPWSAPAIAATASPAPAANNPPSFADSTAEVGVAENTAAGTDIGDPVAATDSDGDSLTYTLGGADDDAHFAIDSKTGQLLTSGALDYEGTSSYTVTVTATDGGGLTASIAVTVTVDDVADTPPGQPAVPEIINIKQTSFRITWTAPTAGSSAIASYGIQYKLSSEADSAYADAKPTKRGTVTGYNVVDRSGQSITAGTSYAVRVRAKNAEGWGPWSEAAIAVTASPDPPPDTAPANGDEAEADDSGQEESADAAGSYQATAYFVQGRVRVKWDDVDGAKHYTVQKNGQLLPGWFIATAFFDGDMEENTRYEYRITA